MKTERIIICGFLAVMFALVLVFTGCSLLMSAINKDALDAISGAFGITNEQSGHTASGTANSGSPAQTTQFKFTLINNGTAYSVSKGTEISGAVVIPATYNGKPVTEIGDKAFDGCENITGITIPASITNFYLNSFNGCTSLTSITVAADNPNLSSEGGILYNKTKTILYRALEGGISATVTIPASVTTIGSYAFSGYTGLTSVTIPNNVTRIGAGAFSGCTNLASITIPASVTDIENTLYNGPEIWFEGAFSGTAWLNSQPDGLVYAGKVLYGYKGTMPANTTINNIRADTIAIAGGAFAECGNLTRITIPASVRYICWQAFSCSSINTSNLTTVIFERGSRLEIIDSDAFYGCTKLNSITIPESVTSIGSGAFDHGGYGDRNFSITIPASVTSVGSRAFGFWQPSQTITIQGSTTGWDSRWNEYCYARIVYQGR